MGFGKKLVTFLNENVVIIAGVSIIIATHWGWSKLQNSRLAPEGGGKELPIVVAYRSIEKNIANRYKSFMEPADSKTADKPN